MSLPFQGAALEAVGLEAAKRAWSEGMMVLKPDGSVVPIPLIAEPVPRLAAISARWRRAVAAAPSQR